MKFLLFCRKNAGMVSGVFSDILFDILFFLIEVFRPKKHIAFYARLYFFFLKYLSIFSTILSGIFFSTGKNTELTSLSEKSAIKRAAVSYTHLTLPTKRIV